jgi:uncharacterized delta-60 repeat protein
VVKLNAAGDLDPTFGTAGVATLPYKPDGVFVAPDGDFVVTAHYGLNAPFTSVLMRLNPDGTPDVSFGASGMLTWIGDVPTHVAFPGDGGLLVSGVRYIAGPIPGGPYQLNPYMFKFTSSGALDPAFGSGGVYVYSPPPGIWYTATYFGAVIQSDGSIRLQAEMTEYPDPLSTRDYILQVQLTAQGALDPGYAKGGSWLSQQLPLVGYNLSNAQWVVPSGVGCIAVMGDISDNVDLKVNAYGANGGLVKSFGRGGVFTWNGAP